MLTEPSIRELLENSQTIAIVGLSPKTDRPSYQVAKYLQARGYIIIPIHPRAEQILGVACFPKLSALATPPDIVNIFIRSEQVMPIVEAAIPLKPRAIWMQLGILHQAAAALARAAGIPVVMDLCIKSEHQKLFLREPHS